MEKISKNTVTFSEMDLDLFAALSRDYNPLHMNELYARKTPYGRRVVFGALGVLKSLEHLSFYQNLNLRRIRVEFHNAIFMGTDYQLQIEEKSPQSIHIKLEEDGRTLLKIQLERFDNAGESNGLQSNTPVENVTCLAESRYLAQEDIAGHPAVEGLFAIGDLGAAAAPSWFSHQHAQSIIMLTSYLIGMELPGQQALFSKLDLQFIRSVDAGGPIKYCAKVDQFDKDMGLLFLDLQLSDVYGNVAAQAKLQSFVRCNLQRPALEQIRNLLTDAARPLEGKTALVIGGSRGLGATFVQALVLSGAHVYLNFARCRDEAESLQQELRHLGDRVTLAQGSVTDETFCRELHDTMLRDRGSIDIVVCNACATPQPMTFSAANSGSLNVYIQENLKLVSNPMQVFLDTLNAHRGSFVAVSSIYVETGSREFPQYVGLKNLMEGLVKSASLNYKNIAFILPRPPKLLTDMSNTPIGSLGAIAPEIVAAKVISGLQTTGSTAGNCYIINNFDSDSTEDQRTKSTAALRQTAANSDDAPASGNAHTYIAATFSADLILPSLNLWKQKLDLKLNFSLAPYNQVFQELLSPASLFNQNQAGRNIIFFRFEDWLPYHSKDTEQQTTAIQTAEDLQNMLTAHSEKFIGAIKNHRRLSSTPLTLALCPSFEAPDRHPELSAFFIELETALIEQIRAIDGVACINLNDAGKNYASDNPRDALRYQIGHIPYTDEYFHVLGTVLIRHLFAAQTGPYKVIVLDCDNTLWSGVCEEAGATGVTIDAHFQQFQKFLIAQQQQGMLLCLCSKNREQAVWDVFEQHPDMLLKKEHLVDHRINWETKSGNIRSLASSLSLGLDSFVFIDDNPVECAEVRIGCPEVFTIKAPALSHEFDNLIRHLWILDKQQVTQEDRQRTRLYQENRQRRELEEQSFSFADFIQELDLKVLFDDINENNLSRVSQLTKRTNQFNLSTLRRSENEITELLHSGYQAFVVSVTDRFGDYGFVGVIIAKIDNSTLAVDTFLLSCRVLGRGVEHQMVSRLGELAVSLNIPEVVFPYVKSKKNEPIARFLHSIRSQLELAGPEPVQEDDFSLTVPADKLAAFHFDYSSAEQIENQEPQTQHTADNGASPGLRYLEHAFESIVFKYSDIREIVRELGSHPDDNSRSKHSLNTGGNAQDTLNRIKAVFSDILGIEAAMIDIDEQLEVLVDESYKIVDLTVALKAKYPHIPQTLLFETRNIRELAATISGDSSTSDAGGDDVRRPGVISRPATGNVLPIKPAEEDIAIIGMNGIFPGANDLETFWENLKQGICSINDIPQDRWDVNGYFDQNENQSDKYYSRKGGFIENIFNFDDQFFSISPREAETMDPQQRLFLQTAWGLLEDAGYTRETLNRDTGVFVGVISSDYALNAYKAALQGWSHYRMSDYYQIPNRVSYYFDLHGPSLAIDSACSSSASAIHLACNSIRNGECATAIVGGVNLISHPSRFIQYSQMQMISKTGVCSPFSDKADGTLFGEGVCALLLKPLTQAVQDGDNIHGVIKSTAVNSGGKTNGFTVPNPIAHAELIGRALTQKNIDPRSISYIEAHGTATNLGDPIEIRGLTEAFKYAGRQSGAGSADNGNKWCALGSVKSNIGHLESGAAIAGIIKCLLQMKYKTLAPTLTNGSLTEQQAQPVPPNAKIPFAETPFKLQYAAAPWQRPSVSTADGVITYPLRAGISSFGAGGSNSHIIVEEAPATLINGETHTDYQTIILSARSASQLYHLAARLHVFAADNPHSNLQNMAYTLHTGREHFSHRLAISCRNIETLIEKLARWLQNPDYSNEVWSYRLDAVLPDDPENGAALPLTLLSPADVEAWVRHWFRFKQTPWKRLYKESNIRKMSLPKTEFGGKSYRIPQEYLEDKPPAGNRNLPVSNPFLGHELVSPFISDSLYMSYFDLHNLPYLTDHRIYGTVVVPASMYIAYALTLVHEKFDRRIHRFGNLTFIQAMMPRDAASQPVQFALSPDKTGNSYSAAMMSRQEGSTQWIKHFTSKYQADNIDDNGSAIEEPAAIDIAGLQQALTNAVDVDSFYKESIDIGFHWGPNFQCIKSLHRRDGEALGLITLPESLRDSRADYRIHPAFLDACFQIFVPSMSSDGLQKKSRQAYLPLGVDQVTFYREVPLSVWSHVVTKDDLKKDSLTLDITLYSESGGVVAFFKGMNVLRTSKQALMALTSQALNKDWCYSLEWQPLTDVAEPKPQNRKTLIFLGHKSTANAQLCRALNNDRLHVIADPQPAAETWTSTDNSAVISLDSADAQAYRRNNLLTEDYIRTLLTTTFSNLDKEETVIFYGLHPLLESANDSTENLLAVLQKNCTELQALLRVIDRLNLKPSPRVHLISHNAYPQPATDKAGQTGSVDASLWSLGRVIALEYPQYWGGMLDLDTAASSADWQRVLQTIDGREEDHLLIRDNTAYAARLENNTIKPAGTTPVHTDGSYLVSGAFGNLGRNVVRTLVAQGARSLILLGRKEPDADAVKLLEELQQQNVQVHRHSIDLGDQNAVNSLFRNIEENHLTLKGIVHLAGVLDDGAFANLDWQRFATVLQPKVAGTWNLHRATQNMQLDFFILFSSASSLLGAPGQANYALANGFMDAFAAYRRQLNLPATSVNWGPWAGVGMAANQQQSRKIWTNASLGSIRAEEGLHFLTALIQPGHHPSQVAVLPYDWSLLLRHYPVATLPSTLQTIASRYHTQDTAQPSNANQAGGDPLFFLSPDLSATETRHQLTEYLRSQVRKILGFNDTDDVDAGRSFLDMGFDSLLAVSFRTQLANTFECYLPATLIFDYPNLNLLTGHIYQELSAHVNQEEKSDGNQQADEETVAGDTNETTHDVVSPLITESYLTLEDDFFALSQSEAEKLLENELDELERILTE